MRLYVGVTDDRWYGFLASRAPLDEVNFWRPSARTAFHALTPGELFLFKLHAPRNVVVGGGFFVRYEALPLWLVWDAFGAANGAASLPEMVSHVGRYAGAGVGPDHRVGCVVLGEPFFFDEDRWIPVPRSFARNIVQGKGYDLSEPEGMALWQAVAERLATDGAHTPARAQVVAGARYGKPRLVAPRLGQGGFRLATQAAYGGQCAVTGEHALPVLEAAHIRPYAAGGPHAVDNGVLLRSDLHRLFDRGYLTFDPADRRLVVSSRLREEFHNGREYYALEGRRLAGPSVPDAQPRAEYLAWHAQHVFLP